MWNPSIGLSDTTIANPIAFPTTTTTYTLSLSDSLCALTDSVSITIDSMIISAGPEGPLCFGVSVQLVVTSSVPGASYSWAPTAGLSCTNCQNPVATPSSDVTYTVTATSNNCSAVDSVTFSVTQLYFANAGADTSICINDSVILNATGGTTYSWSPGSSLSDSTISTPSAFPIINTDYVVLVTDPNGCTDMDTVSVTAFAIPTAAVSSDTGICLGDTIALTASGGTSFSWSPGLTLSDSTSSTPFATPTDTTLYTVTVMNINGCTDTASVTIETYPKPLTDAGPDSTICLGDTIQINASGGGSFQWTPITGISNSNISNPLAFPTSTTTYTLVSSNGTCSDNDVMTITVIDVPVANFIIDSIVWKTVYFQNTSVDATSFRWDFGDGKSDSTNFNPMHLYDTAGTFNVTLFVFNKCGSDSISVPAVIVFTDVVNLANATTLKIYPNPYSGYTNISYKISKSSKISLKVFDLLGREIETLVDAEQSSGTYTYQFSAVESIGGQGIAPENAKGIYILRMMVDDELYIRKLIEVDK